VNINGLQNLGFVPQAKPAKGNAASEKGESSSFEDVLAQSDRDQQDQVGRSGESGSAGRDPLRLQRSRPAEPDSPDRPTQARAGKSARETKQVEESALPSQPNTPVLDKPMVGDRFPNAPMAAAPMGEAKPAMPMQQDPEVDNLTRRVVWNDFLRKMQDELGISAEDVMNAFRSLSEEDLAKPPQQTVDKIVMALGLDGQQAQVAKQYFTELINKTQPRSMGEELASSEKQISLTLMSQREIARRKDAQAVNNLQQKFFMQGQFARPQEAMAAQAKGQQPYIPKATMDENGNLVYQNDSQMDEALGGAAAANGAGPDPLRLQRSGPAPFAAAAPSNELVQQMKPMTKAEKESAAVDSVVKNFMSGQAQSKMMAAPAVVETAAPAAAAAGPAAAGQAAGGAASAAPMMAGLLSNLSPGSDQESSEEYTSDASYLATQPMNEGPQMRATGPSEFAQQLTATDAAKPMAVPDLVQTAQVMVRDGGGEMKVTLAPDGLGEVAMRVSVKEGKVNVQMITESDEAKKLIERQLGELKTSLVSQNLSIEGIKVDTATNIGKQMEQQYQDAQRQMAQQTLEQFRQDQQGWRRSFFETPALKVYKGQGEAPRDIPGASSASSKSARNRRLDLVA